MQRDEKKGDVEGDHAQIADDANQGSTAQIALLPAIPPVAGRDGDVNPGLEDQIEHAADCRGRLQAIPFYLNLGGQKPGHPD